MRVSARLTRTLVTDGEPEWLRFIWAANAADPGVFGAPTATGRWWAGGDYEEYPDARVVLDEDSVRIVSKTERGATAIRAAADQLRIHVVVTDVL